MWIADTWWNWTKRTIQFETFQKLVDDRAAKGFNIGQLFVPGNGWGRESSLLDRTYNELDIRQNETETEFIFYWYNPATGESTSKKKSIKGNRTLQLIAPGMCPRSLKYSDWVLHVFKK